MKKCMIAILMIFVLGILTACGSQSTQKADNQSKEAQAEKTTQEVAGEDTAASESTTQEGNISEQEIQSEQAEEATTKAQTDTQSGSKILVAYFSWSGNTKKVAEMIAEETGADLFEITPKTPYTEDYDTLVDQAQEEQKENARPEIANTVDNWDSYDTVFVGYPNWWSDVPMIINTFLESYDFSGKQVVPFCTHGGGGFGGSLSSVKKGAKDAKVLDGFEVSGSDAENAQSDVKDWLDSLNIQ